jgi:hypothetical protein
MENKMSVNKDHITYVSVFSGETAKKFSEETGLWLLANVEQSIGWPNKELVIIFRDKKILLLPAEGDFCPVAAIKYDREAEINENKLLLLHFLSALAWVYNNRLRVAQWTKTSSQVSGKFSHHFRIKSTSLYCNVSGIGFRPTYLPDPQDKKLRLALALYREGLSLNHEGYAFLSFYKIINLIIRNADKQKKWINKHLFELEKNQLLKQRLDEIRKNNSDVGRYLYESCRCSVAHAGDDHNYDPENIEDEIRLWKDKPLIMHLAKIMIEKECGVKSLHTVYKEHLFELQGFKEIIGQSLTEQLKKGETLGRRTVKIGPRITLRLRGRPEIDTFKNLMGKVLNVRAGVVSLELTNKSNLLKIFMTLDFPQEKIIFDPFNLISLRDDGSAEAALMAKDSLVFQGEYITNGALEICLFDTEEAICWCSEYIPVNINPSASKDRLFEESQKWEKAAQERL